MVLENSSDLTDQSAKKRLYAALAVMPLRKRLFNSVANLFYTVADFLQSARHIVGNREWSHFGEWRSEQPVKDYTDPAIAKIVARFD